MFNLQQWLDPEVGSSMLGLMSYLKPTGIEKVDDYTVKLNLDSGELAVPEHLFHYPAMIVPKTFEGDITKQPIGTGPFLMDKYVETERAELVGPQGLLGDRPGWQAAAVPRQADLSRPGPGQRGADRGVAQRPGR